MMLVKTVWYFIIVSYVSGLSSGQPTQIGPFNSQEQCDKARAMIHLEKTLCYQGTVGMK